MHNLFKARRALSLHESSVMYRALANEPKKNDDVLSKIVKKIEENSETPIQVDRSELDKPEWERRTRTVSVSLFFQISAKICFFRSGYLNTFSLNSSNHQIWSNFPPKANILWFWL